MHTTLRWLVALALAITFCGTLVHGPAAAARTPVSATCRPLLTFFGGSVTCYTAAHTAEAAARLPVRAIDPRAAVASVSPLPLLQALIVQSSSGGSRGRVTALAYLFGVAPAHGGLACPGSVGPRYLLVEETPGRSGAAGIETVCPGLWQGDAPGRSISLHLVSNQSRAVVASLLAKLVHGTSTGVVPAPALLLPAASSSTPTATPAFPTSGGGSAGPPAVISATPPSTSPVLPSGIDRLITEADDGGTLALNVGDRALLALDGAYTWQVRVDDPSVLAQTNDPAPPGSQGIFQALAPGHATLTAIGSPICSTDQPCAPLARVFSMAITQRVPVGGPVSSPTATAIHGVPASPDPGAQMTITQADNGRIIPLGVGDRVLLDLGDSLNWEVRIDNPAVLARVIGVLPISGAQGIFEARAAGTAILTATGSAICLPDQACPQFLQLFKVAFVVGNAPPPTPTSTPIPGTPLTVTLADNGRTIPLNVGDRFLLDLGSDFNWSVQIGDPAVIARVPGVDVIAGDTQGVPGLFQAEAAGTTTLTAFGDPPCRSLQPPCGRPSLLFRITLVVGGGSVPIQRTVTLADNGQTIALNVGDRFLLALGGAYPWKVQIADPSIISPLVGTVPPTGPAAGSSNGSAMAPPPYGVQGLFEAKAAGTTTLTAFGNPPCLALQPPCELPSMAFRITLVVGDEAPPPSTQTITQADNGRTISLKVGDRFLIALGGTIAWSVRLDDPSIVAVLAGSTSPNGSVVSQGGPAVAPPPSGMQGLFEAERAGQITLQAVGSPSCPGSQACPALAAVFSVHLVVQKGVVPVEASRERQRHEAYSTQRVPVGRTGRAVCCLLDAGGERTHMVVMDR